jgi:hypothetical protein
MTDAPTAPPAATATTASTNRGRRLAGAHPSVWVLRGLVVTGAMAALLAGAGEGYTPPVTVVVLVGLGALVSAFRPEHLSLTLTLGLVVVWWALQLREEMPGVVLVVAGAVTLAHVSATLLSYGPPSLPVDRALALLWGARGALSWSGALVVWVVARAYSGHGTPALFWLSGLTAAVVAAVVAGLRAPLREESGG